jgi:hypothetical protein
MYISDMAGNGQAQRRSAQAIAEICAGWFGECLYRFEAGKGELLGREWRGNGEL